MIADSLKYHDAILQSQSGDIYRIASIIVNDKFSDDAIVNPMGYENENKDNDAENESSDKINLGIF